MERVTSPDPDVAARSLSAIQLCRQIIYQTCLGFGCAVRGFILSWNNNYVWTTQQRSLLSLLICTLIVYITLVLCFLPFRFLVWLTSFVYKFDPSQIEWFNTIASARTILFNLVAFIPLLAVFVMNNLLGYDKLFFSVLASVNPSLAERLNCRARLSFARSLYYFLRRNLVMFLFVISLHFLRTLPFVGQFLPALWAFRYARHTITHTKHVYLRTIFFILLVLLTIFKSWHPYVLWLLQLQMASSALARELFDTYLSRIHTATINNGRRLSVPSPSPPSRYQFLGFLVPSIFHPFLNWPNLSDRNRPINPIALPHRKIHEFVRENYFLLLAFAFPYIFLFSIPLLGFFCVGFAHGAAAYTLAMIAQ